MKKISVKYIQNWAKSLKSDLSSTTFQLMLLDFDLGHTLSEFLLSL